MKTITLILNHEMASCTSNLMLQLFKDRNFIIFWLGELISVIGDHVSFIAFPWLVLNLTGSPLMMGIVLAVQGLPRALLMLLGGAVVDRTSPRTVMLYSNLIRGLIMVALGLALVFDTISMPFIFAGALVFGVADAFYFPAATSITPSLVAKDRLQSANALVHMTMQLGIIIGPVLAGVIIAGELTTATHTVSELTATPDADREGLARAFLLDAVTFMVSALSLLFVRTRKLDRDSNAQGQDTFKSMISAIKDSLAFVWVIPAIRLAFFGIAVLELFFQAPIFVGLPALMKQRFTEGAYIYGLIVACYGLGALLGGLTAGATRSIPREKLVRLLFIIFTWSGATVGLMVIFNSYEIAMLLFFTAGLGDAYIWVHFTTLLQTVTPEAKLGRVMSIFMFLSVGLVPIAGVIMGAVFEWNLELGLIGSSAVMVVVCLIFSLLKGTAEFGKATQKQVG